MKEDNLQNLADQYYLKHEVVLFLSVLQILSLIYYELKVYVSNFHVPRLLKLLVIFESSKKRKILTLAE